MSVHAQKQKMISQADGPLVTVITATFNRAGYLPLAIESVLNQTHRNLEYFVIDDGSTDDTKQIMPRYVTDPRVHYLYQENRGQSAARNVGILRARGQFVCFLDSDNLWEQDKLERQLRVFKEHSEADIVYGDGRVIDEKGNRLPNPPIYRHSGMITHMLLRNNFVSNNTAMTRRVCFEEMGGFDETLHCAEDYDLWLRFSVKYRFHYEPRFYAVYRLGPNRLSENTEKVNRANEHILTRFFELHPDVADNRSQREILCRFYARWGRSLASAKQYQKATAKYAKSLSYSPFSVHPWRSLLRMLILWN